MRSKVPVESPTQRKVIAIYPFIETNPYQGLLAAALERHGDTVLKLPNINSRFPVEILAWCRNVNVLHLHWVEGLYEARTRLGALVRTTFFLMLLIVLRARGIRIVYTLHNLLPHDTNRPRFHLAVRKLIVRLSHVTVVHSRPALNVASSILGSKGKFQVIAHGHYDGLYPSGASRTQARCLLKLPNDTKIALFFGSLFRYKCVGALVNAANELARRNIVLVIAGDMSKLEHSDREALRRISHSNVILHEGFVPDSQVQYFMKSADCLVLPYIESFTSGMALLGLSFRLPLVGTNAIAFKEFVDLKLCSPCVPDDPASLAGTIEEVCSWDRAQFERRCESYLANCGWDQIAEQHLVCFGLRPSVPVVQRNLKPSVYEDDRPDSGRCKVV
jgi:beta-1,4-mannosyltransferase